MRRMTELWRARAPRSAEIASAVAVAGDVRGPGAQAIEATPASPDAGTDTAASFTHLARAVHDELYTALDLRRDEVDRLGDAELKLLVSRLVAEIIARSRLPAHIDSERLERHVRDEAVGFGPLEALLADDEVTEIMANGPADVFVERRGRLARVPVAFTSTRAMRSVIERIVTPLGRRIDDASPYVDGRLPDGSRVNVIIPPLAIRGPAITIRKFAHRQLSPDDLMSFGSLSREMLDFLTVCIRCRRNVVVSGGTGSGKTTLLNVLSNLIPADERIVTIEDAAELRLAHPNVVTLEARPKNVEGRGEVTIRDLVRNALRMRPDRIVVGECRGGEALDMLQAMNTGHDGSLTTAHANTPRDLLSRVEVMVLMAGMDLPIAAIREQIASALHVVVQQTRFPCGTRRITRIVEVTGVEGTTIQMQDVFRFVRTGSDAAGRVVGRFEASGHVPSFYDELRAAGVPLDLAPFSESHEGGSNEKRSR